MKRLTIAMVTSALLVVAIGQPSSLAAPVKTKAQLSALRSRVGDLELLVAEQRVALSQLTQRVEELDSRTQQLDSDGVYYGYVDGAQVWSHYCAPGRPTSWVDQDDLSVLGC